MASGASSLKPKTLVLDIPCDGGGGAPTRVDLTNDMFPGQTAPGIPVGSLAAVEGGEYRVPLGGKKMMVFLEFLRVKG